MQMKKENLSLSIAVAAMIFAAATTSAFIKAEGQQGTQSFSGSLLGSNEKPPTESNSTGTANFQANENNSMISYTLNVTGIKKITQANIRNGSQGENGDILVILSKSKSAKGDERPPKIGFSGKITKDDLTGPLKGKELSDLISLMSKGNAYANIQTEKYPKGAIRAQIASSETGATSNETLTPTGNATNATTTTNETTSAVTPPPTMEQPPAVDMSATNATTTTNETTSAVTPPPTMEQPPAVDMSATNATTTTNETTSAVTPPPTMEQPPAVDMSATNATTTTNETTSAVTPPPTMEQPPAVDMSATNATTTTNETTGTTSEASTFPANQSTSAPNLDIDESMR